ncbi:MAG TPA: BatD family protein [Bacteroidia bacterium]|jgi:hypothetical protein|nr:BatD family protein [Bacteroidia bacterium]
MSGPDIHSSLQYINDKPVQAVTYVYIVQSNVIGNNSIGPASIKIDGQTITSNSLTIRVTGGDGINAEQAKSSVDTLEAVDSIKRDLFVKVMPNKKEVYAGEQVLLNVAFLYSGFSIQNLSVSSKPISPDYLSSGINSVKLSTSMEVAGNRVFNISQGPFYAIYPKHEGNISISQGVFAVTGYKQIKVKDDLSQFFGKQKKLAYKISSDQSTLQVKPLPATSKAFSGLIGYFKASVYINEDVKVGDTVHAEVVVAGQGNLKVLSSLPYKFTGGAGNITPKVSDSTFDYDDIVMGTRIFDYALPAKGSIDVSACTLVYFDPEKNEYLEMELPGFKVKPGTRKKD